VVGHHPHVAQEVEKYKGKYIAYSLGNFVFDQDFSKETMEGLVLEATIKDKAILWVKLAKEGTAAGVPRPEADAGPEL